MTNLFAGVEEFKKNFTAPEGVDASVWLSGFETAVAIIKSSWQAALKEAEEFVGCKCC